MYNCITEILIAAGIFLMGFGVLFLLMFFDVGQHRMININTGKTTYQVSKDTFKTYSCIRTQTVVK